jgi:hypothetical protein
MGALNGTITVPWATPAGSYMLEVTDLQGRVLGRSRLIKL